MRQSDERVPGRGRGIPPPSFGRGAEEPAEDFTIRGGESFHLVLHVDVTPDPVSLDALRAAVAAATRAGVLDGYAAAFAEMGEPDPTPEPADAAGGDPAPAGAEREGGPVGG